MKMSFLFLFVTGINSLDFLAYTASEQHSAEERQVPRIRHSSDSRDWKYPSVLEKAPKGTHPKTPKFGFSICLPFLGTFCRIFFVGAGFVLVGRISEHGKFKKAKVAK